MKHHQTQTGDDAAPHAGMVVAREVRGQQREDHGRDRGRKDLLRKTDQLGRVVDARDVAGLQRRGEEAVEEERDLTRRRPNDDRTQHDQDLRSPGWCRSITGR